MHLAHQAVQNAADQNSNNHTSSYALLQQQQQQQPFPAQDPVKQQVPQSHQRNNNIGKIQSRLVCRIFTIIITAQISVTNSKKSVKK